MLRRLFRPRPSSPRIWLIQEVCAVNPPTRSRMWYRLRFDCPISEAAGEQYASDPEKVAAHAFFPFLSYVKVSPRYRKVEHKVKPKERPIRYASHLDTAIYRHYANCLSDAYEDLLAREGLQECVVAYRRLNKSNVDLAVEVFGIIRAYLKNKGSCFALCIDIEDFFESLDHKELKARWQELLGVTRLPEDHYNVFKSVTRYAYVERDKLFKLFAEADPAGRRRICSAREFREKVRKRSGQDGRLVEVNRSGKGVPQGSPISAVLSNLYMVPFDKAVNRFCTDNGCHYRRYSDDIILVGPAGLEDSALSLLRDRLQAQGLRMNESKTELRHFRVSSGGCEAQEGPLQYLGLTYDGEKVLLRSSTLSRYHRKLRRYIAASERKALSSPRGTRLCRRRTFRQFTMRGRRNFIDYAVRADEAVEGAGLRSGIRNQVRRHWVIVNRLLMEADNRVAATRSVRQATSLVAVTRNSSPGDE